MDAITVVQEQKREEKRREAEGIDGRLPGCSKSFYGALQMDEINGVQNVQQPNDGEVTEIECLDGAPPETVPPLRGCQRERTNCEEFQTFARWNSSLITIICCMIVLVVISSAAYVIFLRDPSDAQLSQLRNKTCPLPRHEWIGSEIGTGSCNRMFDVITFPSHAGDQLKMCVNKDEDEKIAMLLDATGGEELDLWEHWDLDCAWAVTQLMLKGPFSYKTLVNFKTLFGSNTRKLVVSGPQICESSYIDEQVLDPIIFTGLSHLTFFNMSENCDKLIDLFIRGVKLDTSLIIEFNSVRVNEYIKKTVGRILSKGKISAILLYNLKFDNDDYLK